MDTQHQLAVRLFVKMFGLQKQSFALKRTHQVSLGERWALIRDKRLVSDQGERACKSLGPEARNRLRGRLAGPDNDKPLDHEFTRSAHEAMRHGWANMTGHRAQSIETSRR